MACMTSRERILAALEGRIPDRVPTMELFIDPKVIDAIAPGMSYEDFIDYAEMDAVTCLTMADLPENINWVDRPKGLWRDKWGALQQLTEEIISITTPPPRIETEADLAAYEPPDPAQAAVLEYARRLVKRFKGKKAIVAVGEDCFAHAQYLRAGLANLMMDYILQPGLVHKLVRIGVDYHVELYRRLISEGVEIILLGDDYAGKNGPFMSPAHFEQFILPGLKTVVQAVKEAGGFCIKHTDGNIWEIMGTLLSTGVDMLGPLEPAYMPLDEVRRCSEAKVGVLGNVDVSLLSLGSVEEVQEATKELLRRVSPLGGHILSSGNSISSSVRGENFMAMLETGRTFGRYPIDVGS
jgi:uroporphyrinogen decarboxylase